MVKTFIISLNMIHIQSKLLMLHLAVVASIHVVLIYSVLKCVTQSKVDQIM